MSSLRLVLALHNHQPVGNFDDVFVAAFEDSYQPFLDVLANYPDISFCLHTSGSLLDWLVRQRPDYIAQLQGMVRRGQVEILGGGFYEPILPMIPPRDRIGQILGYREYLAELFDAPIRGMWLAERVWEQSLAADIARAGMEFTLLDDFHFHQAGLARHQLNGYFITEDEGETLALFPASETLRYQIPFHQPHDCLSTLRQFHDQSPNGIVVFADDGEKFGTWPNTKSHVYEQGWLRRFLDLLCENQHWLKTSTLSQCIDASPPVGTIYLPDASYREMGEWVLVPERHQSYEDVRHAIEHHGHGALTQLFLKAGQWRNFKTKYPETREMYARMMEISQRLDRLCNSHREALGDHRIYQARNELYQGQCNCGYWHGAFGGLYLPHLRGAIYHHLLHAERALDDFEFDRDIPVQLATEDFDFDGHKEIKIASDRLAIYLSPQRGGSIYEIDVLPVACNLGATLSRRPETYHQKIRDRLLSSNHHVTHSIHDRVVCKEEGLERHLTYDNYRRQNLIEHLLEVESPESLHSCSIAQPIFTSAAHVFDARLEKQSDLAAVTLSKSWKGENAEMHLTKRVELMAGVDSFLIRYHLERLRFVRPVRFAIEWNVAGLATGARDRYYTSVEGDRWGLLGDEITVEQTRWIGLVDEWIGIEVGLGSTEPARVRSYPLFTISNSEAGFEKVPQQITIVMDWLLPANTAEWSVDITLATDVTRAMARQEEAQLIDR